MKLHTFENKTEQAEALADRVGIDLKNALKQKGHASLCVPGGSTPGLFFEKLSLKNDIDWANVHVLLNDERCVEPSSERSNERLIRQTLLINHAAKATLTPMFDPNVKKSDIEKTSAELNKASLPIDVCVLGMGDDGHTASLFPNAKQLNQALAKDSGEIIKLMDVPEMIINGEKEWRLTFTLPVLLAASHHYLLISGESKLEVLQQAKRGENKQWPVSYVLANQSVEVFYTE